MSDLELLVRRRMQEEYAKGTTVERISRLLQELFDSMDVTRAASSHTNTRVK